MTVNLTVLLVLISTVYLLVKFFGSSFCHYHYQKTVLKRKDLTIMATGGDMLEKNDNIATRQLYVVRHGERMDYVFGDNWIESSFDKNGIYTASHMNMPKTLPERAGGPKNFALDAPITVDGHLKAVKVGEKLKSKGISISHVYSSPALRCVATAAGIVKGLGVSLNISVDPGLFELLSLYSRSPRFMTPDELSNAGFDIDLTYEPIWPYSKYNENESRDDMYGRNGNTSQEIVRKHEEEGGNILIVGHAATLDTTTRGLLNKPPVSHYEFHSILCSGYCAVKCIQEYTDRKTRVRFWESTSHV